MEDIVGKMRNELKIDVYKGEAFRIWLHRQRPEHGHAGHRTAHEHSFIESEPQGPIGARRRDKSVPRDSTLEDARRRLLEQEKKLEEYNQQHSGELPTQQQANMQAVSNIQMQIQSVLTQIETAQDRTGRTWSGIFPTTRLIMELFPPPPPPPVTTGRARGRVGDRGTAARGEARRNLRKRRPGSAPTSIPRFARFDVRSRSSRNGPRPRRCSRRSPHRGRAPRSLAGAVRAAEEDGRHAASGAGLHEADCRPADRGEAAAAGGRDVPVPRWTWRRRASRSWSS